MKSLLVKGIYLKFVKKVKCILKNRPSDRYLQQLNFFTKIEQQINKIKVFKPINLDA